MQDNIRDFTLYQYNETVLDPLVLGFMFVMAVLVLVLPRRYAVLPYLATAFYITHIQRLVLFSIDFDMMRILLLFGVLRIFIKSEYKMVRIIKLDKILILFIACLIISHTLQIKTLGGFIEKAGYGFDSLVPYFITRCFVQNYEDAKIFVILLSILAVPIAVEMVFEQYTGRNYFSSFSGVAEFTVFRDGRYRSQAAFSHPILAGTVGASLIPLFVGYYRCIKQKHLMVIGVLAGTVITITSSSSGPILAYVFGLIALSFWRFKNYLRQFWWVTILGILSLHLLMKGPVWELLARIGVISGSTAYHRYRLIDIAIKSFNEWWLFGTTKSGTWGWGLQDITNQFVKFAFDGGFFTLLLFIFFIVNAFKHVGCVLNSKHYTEVSKWISWCWGSSLFVHVVSFMGVSYFGQMVPLWYLNLGIIANLPNIALPSDTYV